MKDKDELAKLQADADGVANCYRIELQSFRDKKYKLATESHGNTQKEMLRCLEAINKGSRHTAQGIRQTGLLS